MSRKITQSVHFVDYYGNYYLRDFSDGDILSKNYSDRNGRLKDYQPTMPMKKMIFPYFNSIDDPNYVIELYVDGVDVEEVEIYTPIKQLICETNNIRIYTDLRLDIITTNTQILTRNFNHINRMFRKIFLRY